MPFASSFSRALRTVLPGAVLVCLCVAALPAQAQFSRLTASMAYGFGGLFSEDYVYGVKRSDRVGDFSSGLYAFDLCYVTRSGLAFGARAHMMRVPLGGDGEIGRFDVMPAILFLGYRRPAILRAMGGFFGVGAGVASVEFVGEEGVDEAWRSMSDRGPIEVTRKNPFVFEVFAGADVGLSEDFSLELTAASSFLDSKVEYEPIPDEGYVADNGYSVSARHISIALGLRWWVELW